jgi:hypothetical protein
MTYTGGAFLVALLALAFVFCFRLIVATFTAMVFIIAHKMEFYFLIWIVFQFAPIAFICRVAVCAGT